MLVSLNYRPRNSIIEKFDTRARWIFSILVLFAIVQFWDVRFLLFFFLLAIFQYALTRLTWAETHRAWTIIFIVVASMVIVNTIITSSGTIGSVIQGGHPLFSLQARVPLVGWVIKFSLTVERLWFALGQALRIFSIALIFMILPFTLDPRLYGVTFRGRGSSDRAALQGKATEDNQTGFRRSASIFFDRLAYTMDLAFRFIPTLARDFSITLDAQRARGYEIERAEGGLIAQARKVAPLIVPITMSSILTGEDVVNAMDLRCFGLRPRTWIQILQYHWYDFCLIGFGILLLAAAIILRTGFHIGDFWVPTWILPS